MSVYAELVSSAQKIALLLRVDSLYTRFLERQNERFKAGDANIVEKTAAETQQLRAANQLQQARADYTIIQSQFGYLLASRQTFVPADKELKIDLRQFPDSASILQTPAVQFKKGQQAIVAQELSVIRAKKLPLINAGYTNQSFVGYERISNADVYYGSSNRFSSFAAGVSFPLFTRSLNARIKAAQIRVTAVDAELADTLALQEFIISQQQLRLQKNQQTLAYYKEAILKQASVIYQNATLQYNNGAINFLEWSMLVNQAIGLEADYIDALTEYNRTVIELNAYSPDF